MSKYADIEPIIRKIKHSMEIGEIRGRIWFEMVLKDLEELPAVDAVPVVRCKNCIHRRKGGFSRSETDGWTVTFTTPCDLGDEGFCSLGEKVTE